MAQHDFAPAWLSFPTPPPSTKVSCLKTNPSRRRHNSSDAFLDNSARGAAYQGDNGSHRGLYHSESASDRRSGRYGDLDTPRRNYHAGGSSRSRNGHYHGGKSRRAGEDTSAGPQEDLNRKEEKDTQKQFEVEDFVSVFIFYRHVVQLFFLIALCFWSHFSIFVTSLPCSFQLSRLNFAVLFHPVSIPHSCPSHSPLQVPLRSSSTSPIDVLGPRLTRLGRRADRKSEFLRALKQGGRDDEPYGEERYDSPSLEQVIVPSVMLLKEMGWQEFCDDECSTPLTEDEMREFQRIKEKLQTNGLRRNGLRKNGPVAVSPGVAFAFPSWKTALNLQGEVETDTTSSDTSDDDI
uniref:Vasculin n=1 Tax=Eptatretus burgeri TaxID=7764 RepID=A0A8C4PXN0_EPTBU